MADYTSIQEMLAAGTANMTVIRNNSKQDDGVDTVATGITWFYFNGVLVTNVYAAGNSFIGFGANAEHLRVNRRDAAMYYLYKETGTIYGTKFFKLRWRGYSYYNQTSDAYLQQYDVFLFDDGRIFLNFFDVPPTTGGGTCSLTCGSQSVTYTVVAGTACQYVFTPANPGAGTTWSVSAGLPDFPDFPGYCPTGTAIFTVPLTKIASYLTSRITWTAEEPVGTTVTVEAGVGTTQPTVWQQCINNSQIPVFIQGMDYSSQYLYLRISLTTEDMYLTPQVSLLAVQISDFTDQNRITLTLGAGNRNNLQKATGPVTVRYTNGDLSGEDALVDNFIESFTPDGVDYKGNQNPHEHLEITGASYAGTLQKIEYASAQDDRNSHLAITGASWTGTLTYIEPI